jgi:23S rRNA G2445 N2-methylase RlmL
VAEAVSKVRPELVNDPTASPWEVVVDDANGALQVELRPRWHDERFAYRVGEVPAASHPTIAAAIARLAGVRPMTWCGTRSRARAWSWWSAGCSVRTRG